MADLVSVVIPVYNTNERFKACFESVLKQKYLNIEVILVDDGSCDASAQICDMVALSTSEFPVYVIHKPNGGVSRARNLGIDFANGKYIVFIDSDDQVKPNHISDFMEAREMYPDAGHIWCGFEWTSHGKRCVYDETEIISIVSRDDYFDLADKMFTQGPCYRLYDVSVLRNHHIKMIENLSFAEDLLFNLDYLDAVKSKGICIINSANYTYFDNDSVSLSHKYREDLEVINCCVLDKMEHYMTKWGLEDSESIAKYYSIVYFRFVDIMQNTFRKENKISYFKKIKYNNHLLHSERFNNSLSLMGTTIPSHLRKVYQTKNYFWIRIYERLIKLYGYINAKG